jgi:orotate phosphoribosyltransferase-like protein
MSGPIATVLPDSNSTAFALGAATKDIRRVPLAALASNHGAGKTNFETWARMFAKPDESLKSRTSSIGAIGANFASDSPSRIFMPLDVITTGTCVRSKSVPAENLVVRTVKK